MAKKKRTLFGMNITKGGFLEFLNKTSLGMMDNLAKSIFGTGLTDAEYEKMAAEDEYADENADVAYMRQRALNEDYGPAWQIQQTAEGFDNVGLNKMLMTGSSGAGASGGTAPQASTPSGDVSSKGDISAILNAIIGLKNSEIEDKKAKATIKKTNAETQGIEIENANKQELLDLTKGDLKSKISFLNQQIETEPVKRALLKAQINYTTAQEAVQKNISALQQIDLKYHDAYQAALTSSAQAFAQLQWTHNKFEQTLLLQQLALNTKQIEIMNQAIVTGKLNNGLIAKQFNYYDSDRKFNRWNTGLGTAFKGLSAVAGLAGGAGVLGKAAGLFPVQNENPYQVYNPSISF